MALIAIRHGQTKLNDADRVRATLNPPMDKEGVQQIAATAKFFKGIKADVIHTSDLHRSIQSGKIIGAQIPGVKVQPSGKLRPWDMGHFAGQKLKKVRKQIDYYYEHPDETPPGSKESYNQFLARFLPVVMPMIEDSKPHILVSHNRNMHALEALAAGKGSEVKAKVLLDHPEGNTKPGGVMIIDRTYQPRFYNEHLPKGSKHTKPDTEIRGGRDLQTAGRSAQDMES